MATQMNCCRLDVTKTKGCGDHVFLGALGVAYRRSFFTFPPSSKQRLRSRVIPKLVAAIHGTCEDKAPWPLVLVGEAGSGKTCAALCMIDHYGGVYVTTVQLTEMHAAAKCGTLTWLSGLPRTLDQLWQPLSNAYLLVLDELAERSVVSDSHFEAVKRLLDARLDAVSPAMPTVVVSNLDLGGIARVYGDKVGSRLSAGTVLELSGDRRQRVDST